MKASDVVVSGHQPGLLPYPGFFEKARAADIFVLCDRFQAVRHQFFNRNELADGTRITVPLDHESWGNEIRDCFIGNDPRWRHKLCQTLRLHFGEAASGYADVINRPWRKIAGLNVALIQVLALDLNVHTEWVHQSLLASGGGNPLRAVSDDADELLPVSDRLAAMTEELGGTVWLSGKSGIGYLDEQPFNARGIRVEYVESPKAPSAIECLRSRRLRVLAGAV
jgi:hypothetical protein